MMQKLLPLLFLLAMQTMLFAQVPTLQDVKASIDKYSANYPKEKVYIQYDKPAYSAGETVWFKAYILKGFENSDLSKNFYVDFTDSDGNVLMHGVYPVELSSAAGNFDIPTWYKGKDIHVRAYSQWMLNFDTAFLYNKDLRIIKKQQLNNYKPAAKPVQTPYIQFFPEGGDLVAAVRTKVAFKAVYQTGIPATVKGVIVNSKGVTVDSIKTIHDGMGYFYLEPQGGETYTAKWYDDTKKPNQTVLPAAKGYGATLEIRPGRDKTGFIIRRSENAPGNYQELHIVATMQQQVVYLATVKLDVTSVIGGSIPTAQLPSGILQATLFDSTWKPVAERISFVNNDDYHFDPEVGFSALGTSKRGRNMLVINVPDSIESNLSVSVTDAGLGVDSSDDIISRLLLTGDLRGRVYHPSYYFSNTSDTIAQHLDLVMLTNGWRRFKWDEVIAGTTPPVKYPRDSAFLSFRGKVYGATPQQLREAGNLFVMVTGSGKDTAKHFFSVPLNSDGTFEQPKMSFFDTLKVYYQFASKAGYGLNNSTEVTFTSGAIPTPRKIFLDKNNLSYTYLDTAGDYRNSVLAAEEARLAELLKETTLQGVTVTAKTKSAIEKLDEKYATGLFAGGDPAAQFDFINDPSAANLPDVFSYIVGRVAGLQVSNSGTPNVSLSWRGSTPDLYIDEVKADVNLVSSLNMHDIAYVKVMRPPFFGSAGGGSGGAIAIYTRRGGDVQNQSKGKGLPYKTVAGYTYRREFYSPNYGTFDQVNDREDVRSTLYWNPMIVTSTENHILKFQFYNNDVTDSFRIIVEGVSKDGRITRIVKVIE
ncbi:MAG TPA: hypothetical protein VG738_10565 [Chitinophagaceae bacterium]|nr:hypothetical protein [Chitinophagaceae bacterium]